MTPEEVAAIHFDPTSDHYKACVNAIKQHAAQIKRVKFLTHKEVEESNTHDGLNTLSFDRGRDGELLLWGQNGRDTVAIIRENTGHVHMIAPPLVFIL